MYFYFFRYPYIPINKYITKLVKFVKLKYHQIKCLLSENTQNNLKMFLKLSYLYWSMLQSRPSTSIEVNLSVKQAIYRIANFENPSTFLIYSPSLVHYFHKNTPQILVFFITFKYFETGSTLT